MVIWRRPRGGPEAVSGRGVCVKVVRFCVVGFDMSELCNALCCQLRRVYASGARSALLTLPTYVVSGCECTRGL